MGLSQWLAAGCHGVGMVEVASVGTDQVEGGDEVDRGGLWAPRGGFKEGKGGGDFTREASWRLVERTLGFKPC